MRNLNHSFRGWPVLAVLTLAVLSCTFGSTGAGTDAASPDANATAPATAIEQPAGSDANAIAFYNGMIITMDDVHPQAQAVLISGDHILAVGSDDEILALASPDTQQIDLQGRTMTPGFTDAHQHRINNSPGGEDAIIEVALEQGWTGLDEMYMSPDSLEAIRQLDREGRLRVRAAVYLSVNTNQGDLLGDWYEAYQPNTVYSPYLKIAGLKFFDDIAWGTVMFWDQNDLNLRILQAHQEGWQIAIHTVGTNSHSMVLRAFEQAAQGQSLAARRHRIEHSFGISDLQIEQMKRLGLIGSVQLNVPTVLMGDNKLTPFYQREPPGAVARWRDLIDSGVVVAGSSDWPVGLDDTSAGTGVDSPMRLIYLAVARPGLNGAPALPWMADQAITVDEAMHLLTINAAYATFDEAARGSITPGKLADLVILSENPLEVQPGELSSIEVWMTMVGGKVEWCSPDHETLCPTTNRVTASSLPTVPPPAVVPATGALPTATPPPVNTGEIAIPAGQPIQIAVLGPGSGDNEAYLYPARLAVRLGVADYGLVHGFSMHLVGFDDGCDEAQGRSAAERITANSELIAVIGSLCSASLRGGLPLFEGAEIVVISPGATGPVLPSFGPNVFNRVVLNDNQLGATGRQVTDIDALPTTQAFYLSDAQRVGEPPLEFRVYMAYGYDAMQLLLTAISQTATLRSDGALVINRADLARAVRSTSNYAGVTGTISFDAQGNRLP